MRKFLLLTTTAAAFGLAVPATSMAQGVAIDTPVGGVRIGEPNYYHPSWGYTAPRYYDGDRDRVVIEKRVYRDRDGWRDRDVRLRSWRYDD